MYVYVWTSSRCFCATSSKEAEPDQSQPLGLDFCPNVSEEVAVVGGSTLIYDTKMNVKIISFRVCISVTKMLFDIDA